MERLQFKFQLLNGPYEKSNILCVTEITTQDGHTYKISDDYCNMKYHVELIETATFTKVKKALKKRNQMRNGWVSLTEELKNIYYDDGNLQFDDEYLEEITHMKETEVTSNAPAEPLAQLLEKLLEMNHEKNIGRLADDFIIEKFYGINSNAEQWITDFEKECERFGLKTDEKRNEILKSFMGKIAVDWYSCTLHKLTIEAGWKEWRETFCNTFASKGWSPIRYALAFEYQTGWEVLGKLLH
ncbi:hypothetical protein WA026_017671 [Henosepilachna vigintioctopunctata]|uniref:Uncharacterized protein n=1 Tax=Henosepilachna vigintioctopunctata TaxID=420089 RepID=A0AAW1U2Y4_9CUCU